MTGSALFAVIAATLWFGLAHFYQGWVGVMITALLVSLYMYIYIYTGSIWLPPGLKSGFPTARRRHKRYDNRNAGDPGRYRSAAGTEKARAGVRMKQVENITE